MTQLTVKELVAQLHQLPQDALVWTEGCDCDNEAGQVSLDTGDNTVLIEHVR